MKCILKDIVDIISGGTPKTSVSDYWGGNIPWISIKDFNFGNVYINQTEKSITQMGLNNSSTNILKKNDIIISARGTVGCLAIINREMAFNQSCYGIRVKNETQINPKYLYWHLKNIMNELKTKTHGSVFDTIIKTDLENLEVNIPDIKVQNIVATIIDNITKKIMCNNEINNNLYELGINVFNNMYDDNNTINLKFGDIVSLLRDGTHNPPKRVENGIPLLTGQTINNGFIEYDKMTYVSSGDYKKIHAKYEPIENDLVLTKIGTVGKVGILRKQDIPMCIHCNSALIRFDENYLDQFTAFWFLNSNYFQTEFNKAITNTVQDFVSLGAMSNLEIKIPKFNIVNSYKEVLKNTLLKMSELNNENCKLTKLRDTLLPKLMNGGIDLDNIEI